MIVKKTGKHILGAELTAAEKKAMDIEINRQIVEADKRYQLNLDALFLWALHEEFGFGEKRLRRASLMVEKWPKKLREHYEMPDDDGFLALIMLKNIGIDVEQWLKESN